MVNNNIKLEQSINTLINLAQGDIFKLLKRFNKEEKIEISVSKKSYQRYIIQAFIRCGWSDEKIEVAFKGVDIELSHCRVKRIREGMTNEK
ncbi:MAG: hypothetical protein U9N42_05915 [Campylobacterota bacterium]|nr:hypothetical protein [Campylobacterota bacterium]